MNNICDKNKARSKVNYSNTHEVDSAATAKGAHLNNKNIEQWTLKIMLNLQYNVGLFKLHKAK